jgi:redox-sensing transcriptional repressor
LYRRLLDNLGPSSGTHIYSHQLAHLAGVSAAQVRRDFMVIGYSGSPNRGYQVDTCLAAIGSLLDGSARQDVALVGLGRLGRSVLAHFAGRRPQLCIAAGFDTNLNLIGQTIEGCPVYGMDDLERVVREQGIRIAILAVPPETGQLAADALVRAGVRSLVDFTALPLRVPDDVFVHHMDITSALESASFFARQENLPEAAENEPGIGIEGAAPLEMMPILRTIEALLAGAPLKLQEIARQIDARVLTPRPEDAGVVTRVYAGDRVRDLLNEASSETLLVTNLVSAQMVRVAKLMELPGICFVDGADPPADILDLAVEGGILVMVSPVGTFETCGLIYRYLASRPNGDRP